MLPHWPSRDRRASGKVLRMEVWCKRAYVPCQWFYHLESDLSFLSKKDMTKGRERD